MGGHSGPVTRPEHVSWWRPWAEAVLAGLAGTTAMTVTTALEERLRRDPGEFVDYDASSHVVTAAATVLGVDEGGPLRRDALFLVTHWGYGSAMAAGLEAVRRLAPGAPAPVQAGVFGMGCQALAFTLFPTVGATPPPWRWRRDVLATSVGQHLVYVATVAVVAAALRSRRDGGSAVEAPEAPGTEVVEVVEVVEVPEQGRFEVRLDGTRVGHLEYVDDPARGVRTMPHTEVDPAHGGRGLGTRLVREALDATRAIAALRTDVERGHNDARWLRERQARERMLPEVVRQAALRFRGQG